jgi:hypothetical protein
MPEELDLMNPPQKRQKILLDTENIEKTGYGPSALFLRRSFEDSLAMSYSGDTITILLA